MFVTAMLAATLAAPMPKSLKLEVLTLDGTWVVVGHHSDGGGLTQPVGKWRWTIDGEELTKWAPDRDDNRGMRFTLRRRPDLGVRAIDYIVCGSGFLDEVRECVYERTGDELRVCWLNDPGGRPDNCTPRKGQFVIVLQRAAETKK